MNDALLAGGAAVLMVCFGFLIFALCTRVDVDGGAYGMCAPARYDSYTAQPAAAPRRIVAELAPPAGWRDGELIAILPAPQYEAWDDGDPDELDDWGDDEPEELPLAVPSWPVRQPAVVDPAPVPVIVNRTAARFASLEVRR